MKPTKVWKVIDVAALAANDKPRRNKRHAALRAFIAVSRREEVVAIEPVAARARIPVRKSNHWHILGVFRGWRQCERPNVEPALESRFVNEKTAMLALVYIPSIDSRDHEGLVF